MGRKEYNKQYRERHKHPCIDCGKLVHKKSTRCPECQLKELHRTNPRSPLTFSNKAEYFKAWKEAHPEYQRRWHEAHRIPCPDCGKPMSRDAKLCRDCSTKKQRNPHWKGGFYRTTQGGYIKLLKPEHPRADSKGYVFEHIVVWEETHGKPLPKGWQVHHLNGITDDNRPKNLVGLPDKKHRRIFAAKAKRIQELEGLLNNQHQLL